MSEFIRVIAGHWERFMQGENLLLVGPWVVALAAFLVAGILFVFVRIALIRRGHSIFTGTFNLYFYRPRFFYTSGLSSAVDPTHQFITPKFRYSVIPAIPPAGSG